MIVEVVNVYGNDYKKKGTAMVTIKDIARLSGYSIGTVSRVINHRSDVSEKAREKVEEVLRQTKFEPNPNAKYLKQQTASSITILVKGTQNIFLEGILEEMQRIFRESDETVAVMFLSERANEVKTAISICETRKPKGLIFLGGNPQYFKESFGKIDVPSVLVSESAKDFGFKNLSSYTTDDASATTEAIDYLYQNGHRMIGIVGGARSVEDGEMGYRRYQSAVNYLKKKKVKFDPETQFEEAQFSYRAGYEATDELLHKNKKITAIFAMSDTLAIGAMRAIADNNKEIPKDISIIGFDGLEYTRFTNPRLATIVQNTEELARKSVEDLLIRINYESRSAIHEVVPYRLLTGESIREIKKKR